MPSFKILKKTMSYIMLFLHITVHVCIWVMYVNKYVCVLPGSQFVSVTKMFAQLANKYAGYNQQLCAVKPTIMHSNDKIIINR